MLKCEVLNVLHQCLVSGMDWELLQDFNEYETEDKLDGQIAFLRHELQFGSGQAQLAESGRSKT